MRRRPLYEVVGQLGMWGTLISGVQASIIEHKGMKTVTWSGRNSPFIHIPKLIGLVLCSYRGVFFFSWAFGRLHHWCENLWLNGP